MNEKKDRDLKQGLDKLENVDLGELTDADLDSVAGGNEVPLEGGDCNSLWCCSNNNG